MTDKDKKAAIAGAAGTAAGAAGSVGTVAAAGTVTGLGATGITSGLAAIGSVVGGGMAAGLVITAAAPPRDWRCCLRSLQVAKRLNTISTRVYPLDSTIRSCWMVESH